MATAETHFLNARELVDAGERAAYLAAVCGGDAGLRARVEEMLRAAEAADAYFGMADGLMPEPAGRVKAEGPGSVIGRYELVRKIGEGGMGEVYLARQSEQVVREVALKIIKLGMDTRRVVARFEAERQALALMNHPNIARVLDVGATGSGRPYFVMELVRGVRITEYCDRRRLPVRDRLRLFIQVCQAVQHAHQKGIVHRDLKPSNILVAEDDDPAHPGSPRVIDFGVAKAVSGSSPGMEFTTTQLGLVGTPAYMSPEQADGTGVDIDTRSDIYSLGVLLYELLAGCTPFDAEEMSRKGLDQVVRMLREEEPVRPGTRIGSMSVEERGVVAGARGVGAGQLMEVVRGDLDWIVMRCLEKDRTRRYATANGLAADLERYLTDQPVTARPPSAVDWVRKAVRRNRAAFGAGVVVVVVLVGATVVSGWQAVRARRAERVESELRRVAQVDRDRAERKAEEARHLVYLAEMGLAQSLWEEGAFGRLRGLLVRNREYPGRGFEWYYWMRRAHLHEALLSVPSWSLASVALSPDGRRAVTVGSPGAIQVWTFPEGRLVRRIGEVGTDLWTVAISPDGGEIAAGGEDGSVRCFGLESGGELRRWRVGDGRVLGLAYTGDGRHLVAAVSRGGVRVWRVRGAGRGQDEPVMLPLAAEVDLDALAVSPDGARVVAAVRGGEGGRQVGRFRAWRIEDGVSAGGLDGVETGPVQVYRLAFSPDGQRLAAGDRNGEIHEWEAASGRRLRTLAGHPDAVRAVVYSLDGRRLVTAGDDHRIKLWDVVEGRELQVLTGHGARVNGVAVDAGFRHLVSVADDSSARIWSLDGEALRASHPFESFRAHSDWPQRVVFSPDGRSLLTTVNGAWEFDAATGRERRAIGGWRQKVVGAAYSPDGGRVATAEEDGTVRLWSVAEGSEVWRLARPAGVPRVVAFLPDGRLVAAGDDGVVAVLDAADGRELGVLRGHVGGIRALAVSGDGRRLASGGSDRVVRVWDVEGMREWGRVGGFASEISSLALSPDGRVVVTGTVFPEAGVRACEVEGGRELWWRKPWARYVYSVAFTPDARRLLVVTDSSTADLLDVVTGREVLRLRGGRDTHSAADIAPDGQSIAIGNRHAGEDHVVRLWRAATPAQCARWLEADLAAGVGSEPGDSGAEKAGPGIVGQRQVPFVSGGGDGR